VLTPKLIFIILEAAYRAADHFKLRSRLTTRLIVIRHGEDWALAEGYLEKGDNPLRVPGAGTSQKYSPGMPFHGAVLRLSMADNSDRDRASNLSSSWVASGSEKNATMPSVGQRKRKREDIPVHATIGNENARTAVERSPPTSLPRGMIPGYPGKSVPLPPSLDDEELVKNFPNHLYGTILLKLHDRGWGAKEIVDAAQCPQLKANTLAKRIQSEKLKRDGLRVARPRKQARRTPSSTDQSVASPLLRPSQVPVERLESDAGRQFRMEQTAIRDIALKMKPNMFTRSLRCAKRTAADDRVIAQRAAEEYEKGLVEHRVLLDLPPSPAGQR